MFANAAARPKNMTRSNQAMKHIVVSGLIFLLAALFMLGCEGIPGPAGVGAEDTADPTIEIVWPPAGYVSLTDTFTIIVEADDTDEDDEDRVDWVKFYVDDVNTLFDITEDDPAPYYGIDSDTTAPYEFIWNFTHSGLGFGTHILASRTTDTWGNVAQTFGRPIIFNDRVGQQMLRFDGYGDKEDVFDLPNQYNDQLPDPDGDLYPNVRMSPVEPCLIEAVLLDLVFPEKIGKLGGTDIWLHFWKSNPLTNLPDSSEWDSAFVSLDIFNHLLGTGWVLFSVDTMNLTYGSDGSDFHVGFSPPFAEYAALEAAKFATGVFYDETSSPRQNADDNRSSEFERSGTNQRWGTMQSDYNKRIDLHIRALVNYDMTQTISSSSGPYIYEENDDPERVLGFGSSARKRTKE